MIRRYGLTAVALFLFLMSVTLPCVSAPNPVAKTLVQGGQAAAATNTQYPVLTGGTNSSSVIKVLRTDDNGQLIVVPQTSSGAAQEVQGDVADGASAASTNPVVSGGVDGSGNVQSVLVDTSGRQTVNIGTGAATADNGANADFVGPTGGTGTSLRGLNVLLQVLDEAGTVDRVRSAPAAVGESITTGKGIVASGAMGSDGTGFRLLSCDANGTLRTAPIVTLTDSSAVEAAAYAAADLVGGKRTITSAVRVSGGAGVIRAVSVVDQAANSAANSIYDLIVFNSDPTGTTFTENAPLDVADADMDKIAAVIRLDGSQTTANEATGGRLQLFANADNNLIYRTADAPFVASGTTSLFCALIARGGPTFAATTDVVLKIRLEQK